MRSCAKSRAGRDKRKKCPPKVPGPVPTKKFDDVNIKEASLAIFCNPFLDILADVSLEFLQEYNINSLDRLEAGEEHMPILEAVLKFRKPMAKLEAGGSGLRTARIVQAILKKPLIVAYYGAIGTDENATKLVDMCKKANVNMNLQAQEEEPTGTCAVLRTGLNRAIVANVGAARLLTPEFFEEPVIKETLLEADYFYITGYFLSLHPEISKTIVNFAYEGKHLVAYNLSSSQLFNDIKEALLLIMPFVDIVFGNALEAEALARANDWDDSDLKAIARNIQKLPKVSVMPRLVIITNKAKPITVATEYSVQEYPVRKLKREDIIDGSGCGDAFVAGFLAQYMQKMPLQLCMRGGIWAATEILQRLGSNLIKFPDYTQLCK